MNNTNDITDHFGTLYHPKSALVFYETKGTENDMYVEHFDMDSNGMPINAHPLTIKEANILAKSLQTDEEKNQAFLKPKGILPTNILHINPNAGKGMVLWYTKAQQRKLYFVDSLGIPNGKTQVPPMLWLASKSSLTVFALSSDRRPPRKRHCITHLTSISTRKAMFVWVLWVLTLKIRLRLRNLYRRGNIIFSILISVIHYVKT